ncbi:MULTISPECIES: nitrate reductase [unclassified Pannonibacter]|uniref:nitrate reductase n=1 Tax=unclassified Pannonibacter TaxID=2627228 RepID=UPI0016445FE6|nr:MULTISPECIES: nitrate reductase [unclassified Pannonibacter]
MTAFINPLKPRSRGIPQKIAEIKGWVRTAFALEEGVAISLSELSCRDEGCPDVETVIGLLREGHPIEVHRLHMPLTEVSEADVRKLAAGG